MYYFAYGSNMDIDRINKRCIQYKHREKALLKGYKLIFDKKNDSIYGASYANITIDPSEYVEGVLYSGLSSFKELDYYEGVHSGHYRREKILLTNPKIEVYTYFACEDKREEGLKPSEDYLAHLLSAKEFLSEEYYVFIKETPTLKK